MGVKTINDALLRLSQYMDAWSDKAPAAKNKRGRKKASLKAEPGPLEQEVAMVMHKFVALQHRHDASGPRVLSGLLPESLDIVARSLEKGFPELMLPYIPKHMALLASIVVRTQSSRTKLAVLQRLKIFYIAMTEHGLAADKSVESSADYLKELLRMLLSNDISYTEKRICVELIDASIINNNTNKTALFNTGELDLTDFGSLVMSVPDWPLFRGAARLSCKLLPPDNIEKRLMYLFSPNLLTDGLVNAFRSWREDPTSSEWLLLLNKQRIGRHQEFKIIPLTEARSEEATLATPRASVIFSATQLYLLPSIEVEEISQITLDHITRVRRAGTKVDIHFAAERGNSSSLLLTARDAEHAEQICDHLAPICGNVGLQTPKSFKISRSVAKIVAKPKLPIETVAQRYQNIRSMADTTSPNGQTSAEQPEEHTHSSSEARRVSDECNGSMVKTMARGAIQDSGKPGSESKPEEQKDIDFFEDWGSSLSEISSTPVVKAVELPKVATKARVVHPRNDSQVERLFDEMLYGRELLPAALDHPRDEHAEQSAMLLDSSPIKKPASHLESSISPCPENLEPEKGPCPGAALIPVVVEDQKQTDITAFREPGFTCDRVPTPVPIQKPITNRRDTESQNEICVEDDKDNGLQLVQRQENKITANRAATKACGLVETGLVDSSNSLGLNSHETDYDEMESDDCSVRAPPRKARRKRATRTAKLENRKAVQRERSISVGAASSKRVRRHKVDQKKEKQEEAKDPGVFVSENSHPSYRFHDNVERFERATSHNASRIEATKEPTSGQKSGNEQSTVAQKLQYEELDGQENFKFVDPRMLLMNTRTNASESRGSCNRGEDRPNQRSRSPLSELTEQTVQMQTDLVDDDLAKLPNIVKWDAKLGAQGLLTSPFVRPSVVNTGRRRSEAHLKTPALSPGKRAVSVIDHLPGQQNQPEQLQPTKRLAEIKSDQVDDQSAPAVQQHETPSPSVVSLDEAPELETQIQRQNRHVVLQSGQNEVSVLAHEISDLPYNSLGSFVHYDSPTPRSRSASPCVARESKSIQQKDVMKGGDFRAAKGRRLEEGYKSRSVSNPAAGRYSRNKIHDNVVSRKLHRNASFSAARNSPRSAGRESTKTSTAWLQSLANSSRNSYRGINQTVTRASIPALDPDQHIPRTAVGELPARQSNTGSKPLVACNEKRTLATSEFHNAMHKRGLTLEEESKYPSRQKPCRLRFQSESTDGDTDSGDSAHTRKSLSSYRSSLPIHYKKAFDSMIDLTRVMMEKFQKQEASLLAHTKDFERTVSEISEAFQDVQREGLEDLRTKLGTAIEAMMSN